MKLLFLAVCIGVASAGYLTKREAPGYITKREAVETLFKREAPGYLTKREAPGYLTKREAPGYLTKREAPGYLTKREAVETLFKREAPGYLTKREAVETLFKREAPGYLTKREAPGSIHKRAVPNYNGNDFEATVLNLKSTVNSDGFGYEYETSNGINAQASGSLKNVGGENEALTIQGQYKYTDAESNPISLTYTADENGFHPEGAHLPVPPPIPDYVSRALKYIEEHPPTPEKKF